MASTDVQIGVNVQRLRGAMTQTELARRMNERGHRWSQPTVVAIEKGDRALRFAEAIDLATILQTEIHMLGSESALVALSAAHKWLREARRDLEAAVDQYERARLEVKLSTLEGLEAHIEIPRDFGRDDWVSQTPEAVIAEMRTADPMLLLSRESLQEYLDESARWDDGERQATS